MIKRLRELNEVAARYGFGPGEQTPSGRFMFTHSETGAKVYVGFNQVSGGRGGRSMQVFEADLKRALTDHYQKEFTSRLTGGRVKPVRNEERRKR